MYQQDIQVTAKGKDLTTKKAPFRGLEKGRSHFSLITPKGRRDETD